METVSETASAGIGSFITTPTARPSKKVMSNGSKRKLGRTAILRGMRCFGEYLFLCIKKLEPDFAVVMYFIPFKKSGTAFCGPEVDSLYAYFSMLCVISVPSLKRMRSVSLSTTLMVLMSWRVRMSS